MCTRPTDAAARRSVGTVFWAPIVVGLAYLPDIANQLASLLGASDARVVTHSFLFGLVASLAVGLLLSRFCGIPWRRAAAVSLFSILTHDVLDLLQATDRQPWWPFSQRTVGFGDGLIPLDPVHEVVLFGAAFLVFLGGFLLFGRLRKPLSSGRGSECSVGVRWVGRGVLLAIILSACVTHYLRGVREMQYEEILVLLNENNFRGVLELADQAQRWPSVAKPGRLDYVRAVVHDSRGERDRAEEYYLRADRADPSYFWVVADLAVFHARGDGPPSERCRLSAPYVERLRRDFADHAALPGVLDRIERKLAAPKR